MKFIIISLIMKFLAKNWKGGLSVEEHSRQKKWPAQGPQAVACLLLMRDSKTSMAGPEEISSKKCGKKGLIWALYGLQLFTLSGMETGRPIRRPL